MRAPKNLLSGIESKHIARNTFIAIPLNPCPSIIAPIYFGGSIPPNAKVVDYTIPPKIPKTTKIEMHAANAAPASKAFVISGRAIIKTAVTS